MARTNNGRPTHHNSLEIEASDGFFPPLKLKEGVLTVTPELGALEFHDGHLLFTGHTDRYAVTLSDSVITSNTIVENTVVETVVHSKVFPANSFHTDQMVRATVYGNISNVTGADDFTVRFKLGGATLHTLVRVGGNVSSAGWVAQIVFTIRSTGATGTLIDFVEYREGSVNQSSADTTVHTIDTTAALTLEMTVEWDAAKTGNIFTSSQGLLELIH